MQLLARFGTLSCVCLGWWQSKETTPGAGRDPQWGGDEDKLVFHNVDPSFVLDVAVHNSNTSYMAMLTMQPTDLGTLQIPVQEFARAGQTTGTYQLESKSGKGSVTLKVRGGLDYEDWR